MFEKQKVFIALGTFDGLHIGHQKVLFGNSDEYDKKIALMFKTHPQKTLCGKVPDELITPSEKENLLKSWGITPAYMDFDEISSLTPEEFAKDILFGTYGATALCCGFNYRFGKNAEGDAELLKKICDENNVSLTVCGEVDYKGLPVSSTRIREAIRSGDMRSANAMLGRYFSYDFEVVHGDARGRVLGSPTINQFFTENFAVAQFGVYASFTEINGEKYASVTNIGIRPTIAGTDEKRSETNIIGYNGDLYGKHIKVCLVEKIRDEMSFGSLDGLGTQIASDRELSAKIIGEEFNNEF